MDEREPRFEPETEARAATGASLRERLGLLRSLWLYRRPGLQRRLCRFYSAFVRPGDLAFDIGAHVGDRTRALAALGARVVALEPNPALAERLRRAFRGEARVTILAAGVGAAPGRATLHVSRATPTVSTLNTDWIDRVATRNPSFARVRWDRPVEVPVETLDGLIDRFGRPAFCKIDVEGHEEAVLAGLSGSLPALSFEFVAGALASARRCIDRVAAAGPYRFNAVAGERRRFLWPSWRTAGEAGAWLAAGAGGVSSGDLYARREGPP